LIAFYDGHIEAITCVNPEGAPRQRKGKGKGKGKGISLGCNVDFSIHLEMV
jgi:hypothetical protein